MSGMNENEYIKQLGEKVEYFGTYNLTTVSFIGEDSAISGLADTNRKGNKYNEIDKSVIQSSITEKIQSDQSKWTCTYKTYLSGSSEIGSETPFNETWQMSMTQYEYPLERYLSADEAFQFNSWKETDFKHRQNFEYFAGYSEGANTPIYEGLTGRALDVAKKNWNGVEAVLKFRPQITKTSTYSKKLKMTAEEKALNHIDNSLSSDWGFDGEWLKSGFDWTENADGTWTLTESWINAPKWDEDLYGVNAWEFVEVD